MQPGLDLYQCQCHIQGFVRSGHDRLGCFGRRTQAPPLNRAETRKPLRGNGRRIGPHRVTFDGRNRQRLQPARLDVRQGRRQARKHRVTCGIATVQPLVVSSNTGRFREWLDRVPKVGMFRDAEGRIRSLSRDG